MARDELLPALGSLVEAGFVVRGAAIRCPRCKIGAVLLLSEQSERVRCRACNHKHLLPVLEEGQKIESDSGEESEHDLLISDGATVTVGECKATASISDKQLRDLLKFRRRPRGSSRSRGLGRFLQL